MSIPYVFRYLILNPKIRDQGVKDTSPIRKAKEREIVFFLLPGLGHGYGQAVVQPWPMAAWTLWGQLEMFKAAEAEIQVPRDSVLSFQ